MSEMKPCFQCGSEPMEIDWSGVIEHSGLASQTVMIMCGGANKIGCPVDVSIGLDADFAIDTAKIEALVVKIWNELGDL